MFGGWHKPGCSVRVQTQWGRVGRDRERGNAISASRGSANGRGVRSWSLVPVGCGTHGLAWVWLWIIQIHGRGVRWKKGADGQGQCGARGNGGVICVVKAGGVVTHQSKDRLSLHCVQCAGNGLEGSRDGRAAVGVVGQCGFDELPECRPRVSACLDDNGRDAVEPVLADFQGFAACCGGASFLGGS